MLTAARNEMLTRVGPGTPMGDLLRRYWQPDRRRQRIGRPIRSKPFAFWAKTSFSTRIFAAATAWSTGTARIARADMSYGWVEDNGIRCSYHGWLVDETGRCLEQPYEDTANPKPSKAGCDTKAYPVKECAGLLFAYLGPLPAPELPVWEPFTWKNGFREIVLADIPCNWFQCQENSIDPVHFEWMHDNWGAGCAAATPMPRRSISSSDSRNSSTASSTSACAKARASRTVIGRSAASRYGRTASISAAISNGACRSTTRTR